jgi:hypothetical protein
MSNMQFFLNRPKEYGRVFLKLIELLLLVVSCCILVVGITKVFILGFLIGFVGILVSIFLL